jgi:hypothetical protein
MEHIDLGKEDPNDEKVSVSKESLYQILEILLKNGENIEVCSISIGHTAVSWNEVDNISRNYHPARYRIVK